MTLTLGHFLSLGAMLFALAVIGIFLILLFAIGIGAGRLFDRWHSSITPAEYRHHIRNIESPVYNHFRGRTPPPAVRQTGPDSGPASQPADNK